MFCQIERITKEILAYSSTFHLNSYKRTDRKYSRLHFLNEKIFSGLREFLCVKLQLCYLPRQTVSALSFFNAIDLAVDLIEHHIHKMSASNDVLNKISLRYWTVHWAKEELIHCLIKSLKFSRRTSKLTFSKRIANFSVIWLINFSLAKYFDRKPTTKLNEVASRTKANCDKCWTLFSKQQRESLFERDENYVVSLQHPPECDSDAARMLCSL